MKIVTHTASLKMYKMIVRQSMKAENGSDYSA